MAKRRKPNAKALKHALTRANPHFTPVGNPAPPLPRNPLAFTSSITSSGVIEKALSKPSYPPRAR